MKQLLVVIIITRRYFKFSLKIPHFKNFYLFTFHQQSFIKLKKIIQEESAKNEETKNKNTENIKLNQTASNITDSANKNETKSAPKSVIIKETFEFTRQSLDIVEFDEKYVEEKRKKLDIAREKEKEKRKRASAINSLESFIYDTKFKLEEKEFEIVTTSEEREKTLQKLNEYNEWLDDADDSVETKVY